MGSINKISKLLNTSTTSPKNKGIPQIMNTARLSKTVKQLLNFLVVLLICAALIFYGTVEHKDIIWLKFLSDIFNSDVGQLLIFKVIIPLWFLAIGLRLKDVRDRLMEADRKIHFMCRPPYDISHFDTRNRIRFSLADLSYLEELYILLDKYRLDDVLDIYRNMQQQLLQTVDAGNQDHIPYDNRNSFYSKQHDVTVNGLESHLLNLKKINKIGFVHVLLICWIYVFFGFRRLR